MFAKFWPIYIFFSLFFTALSLAQNSEQFFVKIIDDKTKEPVSFATIRLKGTNQGVIADYNGEFRMPIIYAEQSIIVSSIGYLTREIALNGLSTEGINAIQLSPQTEALDAVVISTRSKIKWRKYNAKDVVKASRSMTAKEIVLEAIAQIPVNLSDQPHSYIGYYRDYQLVDNKFHNLNEGIMETLDNGISTQFLEDTGSQTAIYSFKQNTDFKQNTNLTKAYNGITKYIQRSQILPRGGNEHTILHVHNPIRNYNLSTFSYVFNLEEDFPDLHKFKRHKVVFLNDEPLALIKFTKSKGHDTSVYGLKTETNNYVEGDLYISLVDFSIHRFNYKVRLAYSKKVLFNVSLEYARQNNHMYLNYISFNNAFVVGEDFQLREEKVIFDKDEQAFFVTFNNTEILLVDRTIKPENFKFKLGNQYLRSVSTEFISGRIIKVVVEDFDGTIIDINKENVKDLTYKFKRIEDEAGREIYKTRSIEGDQFREFFVQKVKLSSSWPNDMIYMDKNLPLEESHLNNFPDANQYWINSPLMDKKYRDED